LKADLDDRAKNDFSVRNLAALYGVTTLERFEDLRDAVATNRVGWDSKTNTEDKLWLAEWERGREVDLL
jgi:hypothetical protein